MDLLKQNIILIIPYKSLVYQRNSFLESMEFTSFQSCKLITFTGKTMLRAKYYFHDKHAAWIQYGMKQLRLT